jgi:hypothetical protein
MATGFCAVQTAEALRVVLHCKQTTQSSSSPVQVTNPSYFLVLNKQLKVLPLLFRCRVGLIRYEQQDTSQFLTDYEA